MSEQRPQPVGRYEVLEDFECHSASVRVLKLEGATEHIDQQATRRSMRIYLSIGGTARVTVDGVTHLLQPYAALAVWPGSEHGAAPAGSEAILVNISIPPLTADDQLPVTPAEEPEDFRLPRGDSDIED